MNEREGRAVIAILFAFFPRQPEPDETTTVAWTSALTEFELVDAIEAANALGRSSVFLPALAEFLGTLRACRNARLVQDRHELPPAEDDGITFDEWLRDYATPVDRRAAARISPAIASLLELGDDDDAEPVP